MDEALAFVAVAAGLLLRIGLPLALTAVLVWGLRRLDARWEAEGEQAGAWPAIPAGEWRCWEVNECPPERREVCPAYLDPGQPCWQHFRRPNGRLTEKCLDCDVFQKAPALIPAHGRA